METSETARLVDYAERLRDDEWSLRSTLVRYAQIAPARAGVLLELIRRTDGALKHLSGHPERRSDADEPLLDVARQLDQIGDVLTRWAIERGDPPHDRVESIARDAAVALGALGVERERDVTRRSGQRRA